LAKVTIAENQAYYLLVPLVQRTSPPLRHYTKQDELNFYVPSIINTAKWADESKKPQC